MGQSMFSDVGQSEPEKQKSERKGFSFGKRNPKPDKAENPKPDKPKKVKGLPKPVKDKRKTGVKVKKKSTKGQAKTSSKRKSESFRAYSYFRGERFKPDEVEVKSSKYLKNIIKLISKKNKNASVVLHRTDDLMSDINDIVLDLEFDMSEDLIEDSEEYINTQEGTINVI